MRRHWCWLLLWAYQRANRLQEAARFIARLGNLHELKFEVRVLAMYLLEQARHVNVTVFNSMGTKRYHADVVGQDETRDLALLKIVAQQLRSLLNIQYRIHLKIHGLYLFHIKLHL